MDESHRYRASAGICAINELKPVLGLEITATPFVETSKSAIPFQNVIFDYPLGKAMTDGFVKEPAVVTRKDFDPLGMSTEEVERIKLEDGVRLHESLKVELETYALNNSVPVVKRVLSVILDRGFKPVKSQFQLCYNWYGDQREYQPDFVAETSDAIYMLEPKARNQIDTEEVQMKKTAAIQWCINASNYTQCNGGKPWSYLLIPHDEIKENMTILGLTTKFTCKQ
jgi:hypothetical protein